MALERRGPGSPSWRSFWANPGVAWNTRASSASPHSSSAAVPCSGQGISFKAPHWTSSGLDQSLSWYAKGSRGGGRKEGCEAGGEAEGGQAGQERAEDGHNLRAPREAQLQLPHQPLHWLVWGVWPQ